MTICDENGKMVSLNEIYVPTLQISVFTKYNSKGNSSLAVDMENDNYSDLNKMNIFGGDHNAVSAM